MGAVRLGESLKVPNAGGGRIYATWSCWPKRKKLRPPPGYDALALTTGGSWKEAWWIDSHSGCRRPLDRQIGVEDAPDANPDVFRPLCAGLASSLRTSSGAYVDCNGRGLNQVCNGLRRAFLFPPLPPSSSDWCCLPSSDLVLRVCARALFLSSFFFCLSAHPVFCNGLLQFVLGDGSLQSGGGVVHKLEMRLDEAADRLHFAHTHPFGCAGERDGSHKH